VKRIFACILLLMALLMAASCTVIVKEKSTARWAVVNTYGGVDVIKVWRMDGLAGESLAVLQPGTKVKILKVKPHAVLIEMPGGNTGWVNRKHFGRDLEVY
jgi:hypothetical protein